MLLTGQSDFMLSGAVAWERRLGWPGLVSNSFRLIQRGEVDLPVSIDLYDTVLSITVFSEKKTSLEFKDELHPLLEYLATKISWQGCLLRHHVRNPHQNKLIHDTLSWGNIPTAPIMAREHDLSYTININDSQHPGLFLDQRDSRRRIQQAARHQRVANLFAFTCSFSVVAVAGDAEVVFSVDMAGSSLKRGKDNFALNDLDQGGRGKFIREDVLRWLARQERKRVSAPDTFDYWDLIICDPPVFGSGGGGRAFHVERQWPELVLQIRLLLSGQGVALFANNHRSGSASFYRQELQKHFKTVTSFSPPLDFPILAGEPEYVRIYWCEV
jgi:23S rRNA G2069 N7-methylase RlmK/C1962 C5-methylase RlmI